MPHKSRELGQQVKGEISSLEKAVGAKCLHMPSLELTAGNLP